MMGERYLETPTGAIIADADVDIAWEPGHFTLTHWEAGGRPTEPAEGGRSSVVFVRHGDDEWALRHYHRGGLVQRISPDRYIWSGEARTRSFREWRLLADLHGQGLPVPKPVAAHYEKTRATYRADILTRRIPGGAPLSARLVERALAEEGWRQIGACIRRFHDAGVCHADLNAHNILLDEDGRPWLLDFDKGSLRAPGRWRRRNLGRLLRSLRKVSMEEAATQFAPANWESLLAGYGQMSA